MRIVLDLQGCQSASRFRGIGRYALALAKAVIRNRGNHSVKLLLNGLYTDGLEELRQQFCDEVAPENILIFEAEGPVAEFDTGNTERARLAELARERLLATINPDAVLITSLFEGFVDDAITSVGVLGDSPFTAVTLYDLIPYLNPDPNWPAHYKGYYDRKIESLKRADLLLSISDYARLECTNALPELAGRVINMSSACDGGFRNGGLASAELAELLGKFDIAQPFIMSAGNLEPRKNFGQLIRAFGAMPAELRQGRQIVLVGGADAAEVEGITRVAADAGLDANQLSVLGHVSDEDLRALYSLCELFVFPSLHEGFGLPPLEAMACGAVVIGSNATSVPEVIGRNDALFDPTSVPELRDLLIRALTDQVFRQSLREHAPIQAAKFSWDKTARKALAAIEAHVTGRKPHSMQPQTSYGRGSKPRLAMVTPLPPERTGIADYAAELLPALANRYDITVITDQAEVWPVAGGEQLGVQTVAWFQKNATTFDRIVYQMGNSPFHAHMPDLMKEHPGVVVLHDFFISSLMLWMEESGYRANAMKHALLQSHGYAALEYLSREGRVATKLRWPCSYNVVSSALGILVHSEYNRNLIRGYYGDVFAEKTQVVRQHRTLEGTGRRTEARRKLGYADDDFVVCAFGFMDPTKLNHVLLDAWGRSDLAKDRKCRLVFVGGRGESDYEHRLDQVIQGIGDGARIHITDFVDHETFIDYLGTADAAVQLRAFSRGETSRTVLDCLAYGIPLIVNANGPMAEYPDNALIKLEDEFLVGDLTQALENLRCNASLRENLRAQGPAYIDANHAPARTVAGYQNIIEGVLASHSLQLERQAVSGFWKKFPESVQEANASVTQRVSELLFIPRKSHIYLDISATARNDLKTGIERVARSLLRELLRTPPLGYDVIPVYLNQENGRWRVRKAQKYLSSQGGFELVEPLDELVIPARGDVLFGLDLFPDVAQAARQGLYAYWRASGAKVGFTVYDLLPITHPGYFPPWAPGAHTAWTAAICANADMLVCISEHVKDEVSTWIAANLDVAVAKPTLLASHLGADVAASFPTSGLPEDAEAILKHLSALPTFLMVGTIEPRKAHLQAIAAFEILWRQGVDVNLVIVGHEGWKSLPTEERRTIPATIEKIRNCSELGKRLFWLEGISDEYLTRIYESSACLLSPSGDEGYGLPLIEAAQHHLPIIARDIAVFREVAGNAAYYFSGNSGEDLQRALSSWLELKAEGKIPDPQMLRWDTWEESARRLAYLLVAETEDSTTSHIARKE